ncbi:Oligomerization domain containing protein [Euroglyphus maynei]|uniref:Oligomerization domain containing protein n=1 Tax=Euroglyphus maynei TaxID=6958 RepID=A0A1Y3AU21_EURMA|nr:Oligomerization domain containing protein [Euroglyphus maynei]
MKKNPQDPFLDLLDKSDDWRLIDLNNLIVHVFMEKTREYYDIETLWAIGSEFDDKIHRPESRNVVQDILDRHFATSSSSSSLDKSDI